MRYGIYDRHGRMLCRTLDEAIHMALHRQAEDGRLRVLMIFERETLMHIIASTAWVEADSDTEAGEVTKATDASTHNYKEVAEDDNWPMVSHWISMAVTEVEQMLYNLTRRGTMHRRSMDNYVTQRKEWRIEMLVKPEASDTTVNLLMNLTNDYLKAVVLREWAGVSYKSAEPYWTKKTEELEQKIREAGRSCETTHVKRPMWPAW